MQKPVTEKKKYFVVRERAVPEVLLKVVEAKKLLDSGKVDTVQDAAERTGISRSSFYKYKDDIFPFHEETRGKTITFIIQMDDEPGLFFREREMRKQWLRQLNRMKEFTI